MAGMIIIDTERCKGCGLCVVACMKDCISISKYANHIGYFPAQSHNHGCTGCTRCAMVCPDTAIIVLQEKDIPIEETIRPRQPITLLKEQV